MPTLETFIDLVDRAHDVLSGGYRLGNANPTNDQKQIMIEELIKDLWEAKWKSAR